MTHRSRFVALRMHFSHLALLAAIALAAPALAQTVRERVITENPNRTVGGSCMYGGDGKLLHAPHGAECPELEQPPASRAEDAAPVARAMPHAPAMQPRAREEIAALLAERERLDVELARVREAFAYEDREAARGVVEEALRKIARHLEHEARVLQPMTTSAAP